MENSGSAPKVTPPEQAPPQVGTPPRSRHPPGRRHPPGSSHSTSPLAVGLETPSGQIPLNFPLGCGPGNLQGMLGIPTPWRPTARHAGIPPAMYAGIALPPPHCGQTDTCKNITFTTLLQMVTRMQCSRMSTAHSLPSWGVVSMTETPLDRDPLDGNPSFWTETPLRETPQTETCPDIDPPGQRPPRTETPPWTKTETPLSTAKHL